MAKTTDGAGSIATRGQPGTVATPQMDGGSLAAEGAAEAMECPQCLLWDGQESQGWAGLESQTSRPPGVATLETLVLPWCVMKTRGLQHGLTDAFSKG